MTEKFEKLWSVAFLSPMFISHPSPHRIPPPHTNENFRQGGRGVSFFIPETQNSQALTPQQPLYTPLPFIPLPPNLQGTKK